MYVKRRLGVGDLMPMVRIIGKIGISDFKKCFSGDVLKDHFKGKREEEKTSTDQKEESEESQQKDKGQTENILESIGFDVALNVVDVLLINIPKLEKELYAFMASMCEVSVEEFKEFPPAAFIDVLHEIFTAEEAKDFFSHVSRLLNWEKSDSGTSSTEDTVLRTI